MQDLRKQALSTQSPKVLSLELRAHAALTTISPLQQSRAFLVRKSPSQFTALRPGPSLALDLTLSCSI